MQTKFNSWRGLLLCLSIAFIFLNGCKDDDDPKTNVKLSTNSTLGSFLVDANDMTLYFFTRDTAGVSVCEGGCLTAWPVFYQENIQVGSGLDPADFGTITRSDGVTKQSTYKGWPLYYYQQDTKAGDVVGEKVGNVWFVAKPDYTLMLSNVKTGQFMVDIQGKSLYYFTIDGVDESKCTSAGCLTNWPLFNVDNFVVPSSLNKTDFKVITRGDGAKQVSYKGKPLYYYKNDVNRGDTKGKDLTNWDSATP